MLNVSTFYRAFKCPDDKFQQWEGEVTMKKNALRGLTFTAVLAMSSSAYAATQNFSFTGNFSGDADVQLFNFSIGAVSDVTLISYSYAGGTMADGTVISAGGFDPILALWDGSGDLIQEYDDGPGSVPTDPATGMNWDSNLLLTNLAVGNYTASIAQYENFTAGSNLSNGFTESDPFFTGLYGCSNGQFCDVSNVFDGNNRSNFWAFDVLGVDSAEAPPPVPVVPLPASLPLILSGLFGLGFWARRKKSV